MTSRRNGRWGRCLDNAPSHDSSVVPIVCAQPVHELNPILTPQVTPWASRRASPTLDRLRGALSPRTAADHAAA